ncbi:excisionase family DNA binding protein [Streptomyces sp. 846.5]|nr:helix-turn-helix domain-containing protein [Streptomyces sp. 846.5]TDU03705.1 excisionase family DNA binding protein [Streptomyces sp. 846.5]
MTHAAVISRATRIEPVAADHDLLAALEGQGGQARLVLRGPDGSDIELPAALADLVRAAAHDLARGNAVLTLPLEVRLTPNEAADLLGFSRPFLLRLIEQGQIPAEYLPGSRHRQLRLVDVLEFQARRERRAEARRRIIEIVEEDDLPY